MPNILGNALMPNNFNFTVGGAVQDGTYLRRPADDELLDFCKKGEFAYVLASRQIGKSSLINKTDKTLSEEGFRTAVIDVSGLGQVEDADRWYFGLIDDLKYRLGLKVNVDKWWEEKPHLLGPTRRFIQFLREVVLKEITESIVIFVDEIDFTLGLDFTKDFFAAIRAIYQDRVRNQDYERLTFVLMGVATPDELISDPRHTPFNIGREIILRDFTKVMCKPLHDEIRDKYPDQGDSYFNQIYDWTSGHPYLTQKLCIAVLGASEDNSPESLVQDQVKQIFTDPEMRGEDNNIQFVHQRITTDDHSQEMLQLYQKILQEEDIYYDEKSVPMNRLRLYGLVVVDEGLLKIRNNIYKTVFDEEWVKDKLGSKKQYTLEEVRHFELPSPLSNKYKGISKLAEHKNRAIYLVQDIEDLSKTQLVTLKLRKLRMGSERSMAEEIERFKRFSQLHHPNIVKILEVDSLDDQTLFKAMEYITGGTLRDKLSEGALSLEEALDIAIQIGKALTKLHEQGIIHCDVNPNNILLDATQKSSIRAVLSDFDSARFLSENDLPKNDDEPVQGTLRYVAPEQLRKEPVSAATDVYALAITFFEMVAGRPPFEEEVISKHLNNPIPNLSKIVPKLSSFFDGILQVATVKEPANRFEQVADFTSALETAHIRMQQAEREAKHYISQADREMRKGKRANPTLALTAIEQSLAEYPGYFDALLLKGKFYFKRKELSQAIEAYQQAYDQIAAPLSLAGQGYLDTLEEIAKTKWAAEEYGEAIEYYERIIQILNEVKYQDEVRERWDRVTRRLTEYHIDQGNSAFEAEDSDGMDTAIEALKKLGANDKSEILESKKTLLEIRFEYNKALPIYNSKYSSENVEALDEAIQVLDTSIQRIESMKISLQESELTEADKIIAELRENQNSLGIKQCEQAIKQAEDAIKAESREDEILQNYRTIDETYQKWINLTPSDQTVAERKQEASKQHARYRLELAQSAENEARYDDALKHYKTLQKFESKIVQMLHSDLDLDSKIDNLESIANLQQKLAEVNSLIDAEQYADALDKLNNDIIRPAKYEYLDVASSFTKLARKVQKTPISIREEGVNIYVQDSSKIEDGKPKFKGIILPALFLSIIPGLTGGFIMGITMNIIWKNLSDNLSILWWVSFVTLAISSITFVYYIRSGYLSLIRETNE